VENDGPNDCQTSPRHQGQHGHLESEQCSGFVEMSSTQLLTSRVVLALHRLITYSVGCTIGPVSIASPPPYAQHLASWTVLITDTPAAPRLHVLASRDGTHAKTDRVSKKILVLRTRCTCSPIHRTVHHCGYIKTVSTPKEVSLVSNL